jgi:hypothetical protein
MNFSEGMYNLYLESVKRTILGMCEGSAASPNAEMSRPTYTWMYVSYFWAALRQRLKINVILKLY